MKGKKVGDVLNRLHVAMPAKRDNRVCTLVAIVPSYLVSSFGFIKLPGPFILKTWLNAAANVLAIRLSNQMTSYEDSTSGTTLCKETVTFHQDEHLISPICDSRDKKGLKSNFSCVDIKFLLNIIITLGPLPTQQF